MTSSRVGQIGIPAAVVAIVCMLVVPLPPVVLDLLLVCNIAGSVLILLVSMQVKRALDFAVFPSLLLVATLFRLALNVSVTASFDGLRSTIHCTPECPWIAFPNSTSFTSMRAAVTPLVHMQRCGW